MSSRHKSVIRNVVLAAAALTAGVASAHGHGWGRDRDDYDGDERYYYPDEVIVTQPRYDEFVYARVVDVDPIVRRVAVYAPQQECWYEDREVYPQRGLDRQTTTPTIVGAVIGGVIGHQFGRGHSRDLGTVAGAVLGAAVGHDVAVRSGGSEVRSVERCATRGYPQYQERIEGYRVTYRYRGCEHTSVMPYDPGDRVRLRVGANMVVVP